MSSVLRWLLIVGGAVVFMAIALANRTPGAASHVRFAQGDCAECHESGSLSGAPADHQSAGWPVQHGRGDAAVAERCGGCHSVDTCRDCHTRPPATHTLGFRRPDRGGPGARQHAILGRLRSLTCVNCHTDAPVRCASCHRVDEARGWVRDAAPTLAAWGLTPEGDAR